MYIARIRLHQPSCLLAYATQRGSSLEIMEYIPINNHAVFLCRIKEGGRAMERLSKNLRHGSLPKILSIKENSASIEFIAVTKNKSIRAFEENYCFVKTPIKINGGNMYFTVFSPGLDNLRKACSALKRIGSWDLLEINSSFSFEERPLTRSQIKILKFAHEMGYFDKKKRRVSIQQIADAVGLSKSTVHKHLRDALCKIVDGFVENET